MSRALTRDFGFRRDFFFLTSERSRIFSIEGIEEILISDFRKEGIFNLPVSWAARDSTIPLSVKEVPS